MKKMKVLTLFISISLMSFFNSAHAYINVGTYVPNFLSSLSDTEGGKTKFALNPFISFDQTFMAPFGLFFNPEVGYVLHTDNEDETSHSTIFILFNFDSPIAPSFSLRWGFGTFISRIGGSEDAVELKDGSSTATFYTPSETRISYTSSLNLGSKFIISSTYSIRFDLNVDRFLSERRNLSYLLSFGIN